MAYAVHATEKGRLDRLRVLPLQPLQLLRVRIFDFFNHQQLTLGERFVLNLQLLDLLLVRLPLHAHLVLWIVLGNESASYVLVHIVQETRLLAFQKVNASLNFTRAVLQYILVQVADHIATAQR
jgi:hypothetical protein